ncbi:MAG: hypothetical protein WC728_03570 [Elusimicrobiota bacterium]
MRRALRLIAALTVVLAYFPPVWGQQRPRYRTAPEKTDEEDTDAQTRRRKRQPPPEEDIDTDARPVRRKRSAPPPDANPGERDEIDPDAERNPCDGTATDLTEILGVALNRMAMRKADGRDFKNFRKRRERQQKKFPDAPGYEMLAKVVVPAERELVRGYNGLVEKGLVPLAAAGVYIDDAIAELRDVSAHGTRVMEDIDAVTAELERIAASFDADSFSGGGSVDLSALKAHERELPRIKERIKDIKDQVCRADVLVRAAAEGPRLGLRHAARARELAEEADKRDAEAIDRATQDRSSSRALKSVGEAAKRQSDAMSCTTGDCLSALGQQSAVAKTRRPAKKTSGCPTGNCGPKPKLESIEGRSGPVIEDAAEKLVCAAEQTETARKNTDLVSNPTHGKLMKAALTLERAAEIAMAAATDGKGIGGGQGGRGARGCGSCGSACSGGSERMRGLFRKFREAQTDDERAALRAEAAAIVAKVRESFSQTKDEVKAAQNAADSAKSKLESAAQSWESTVRHGLGVRDENTLDSKLPRLPEPDADIHAPRAGGPATHDAQAAPKPKPRHPGESDDSDGIVDWKSHQKYRKLTGQDTEE